MLLIFLVFVGLLRQTFGEAEVLGRALEDNETPELLEVFQTQAPLRVSYDDTSCQQVILQHDFKFSYGAPYVGLYSPPTDCNFTTVIFNMSITSAGINYDRLGMLFLGDVEVWRTTTAMPVRTGIFSNFLKDVTVFYPLLRTEQKVIMDLGNRYDDVFTASFNVTVTALYYDDDKTFTPANSILPISAMLSSSNQSSVISLPDGIASVPVIFPRNVERAVVRILAHGNGDEEFWLGNVPTDYTHMYRDTPLRGYSPFREVQLLIDGELVGVSWPQPTIFTGGISPGLWAPIVGTDAYDLPSFEIDVSVWLGLLCDGESHTFELKVVGWDRGSKGELGTVGSDWLVSGSIFLWLDAAEHQTTASTPKSQPIGPEFYFSALGRQLHLSAERSLQYSSEITTSSGTRLHLWSQSLNATNIQTFAADGYNRSIEYVVTAATSCFSKDGTIHLMNEFMYPMTIHRDYLIPIDPTTVNSTIVARVDRTKESTSIPILSHLTSPSTFNKQAKLSTRQTGNSTYSWNNTHYQFAGPIDPAEGSHGRTCQRFNFTGPLTDGKMYTLETLMSAATGYEPNLTIDHTWKSTEVEGPLPDPWMDPEADDLWSLEDDWAFPSVQEVEEGSLRPVGPI